VAKDLAVLQITACDEAEIAWGRLVSPAKRLSQSQLKSAIDRLTSDLVALRGSYSEHSWIPDHPSTLLAFDAQRRSRTARRRTR